MRISEYKKEDRGSSMKKTTRKILCMLLALAMLATLMSGCAQKKDGQKETSVSTQPAEP